MSEQTASNLSGFGGARAWPTHEVSAVLKGMIAGWTEDELKKMVSDLVQARGKSFDPMALDIPDIRVERMPALQDRTGLKRAAIYVRIKKGIFPPSISLGGVSAEAA